MFGEEDIDPELIDDLYEAVETTAWRVIEDCIKYHGGTYEYVDGELIGYDKYGYMAVICRQDILSDNNEADLIVIRHENMCDVYRVWYSEKRQYLPYWTKNVPWKELFGSYVRSSDADII